VSDDDGVRKRQRVRRVQRYVLNPPMHVLVRAGLVPGLVLLETRGRRTGRRRRTVVGMHVEGETGWVVAEQGRHAGYVRNIEARPDVRLCRRGRWHGARAHLEPDDDAAARLAAFGRRSHAASVQRFGTDLMSVRFDLAPDDAGAAPPG
jgi:deazaflavin-dependent oxidoreductase (nitroreductase family)